MIQESLLDSLIPAAIPRAIDVIRNGCGPLVRPPLLRESFKSSLRLAILRKSFKYFPYSLYNIVHYTQT